LVILASVTPDYLFPSTANVLCDKVGMTNAWGFDLSAACSGFLFALTTATECIENGRYKKVLVVGVDKMSSIVDYTDRTTCVIFGDGAGAVVLQPTEVAGQGVLSTHLHSDGESAEILAMCNPGTHANHWKEEKYASFDEAEIAQMFFSHAMIDDGQIYPYMDGPAVFKKAVVKFPEVIMEALTKNNLSTTDINLLIPHQANLRIAQFVQQTLKLRDDQVYNNIQQYGNTTAASIPIALCEAWEKGLVKEGDLVCLAAFGSGFTWASALVKW
jgi:3-oxoacyl-[acyl-carrier-protein] synthase-3